MKEKLVKKYFDKFIDYINSNRAHKHYDYDSLYYVLQDHVKEIVNNNREYLLTDSFIWYLIHHSTYLIHDLCSLYEEDDELPRLTVVFNYFVDIYIRYYNYGFASDSYEYSSGKHVGFLDDDIRIATIKAYDSIQLLQSDDTYDADERYLLRTAVNIILAYCFVEKKINEFSGMIDIILRDPTFILDDITVNNLDIDDDNSFIIERITRIIDSKFNRVIK